MNADIIAGRFAGGQTVTAGDAGKIAGTAVYCLYLSRQKTAESHIEA